MIQQKLNKLPKLGYETLFEVAGISQNIHNWPAWYVSYVSQTNLICDYLEKTIKAALTNSPAFAEIDVDISKKPLPIKSINSGGFTITIFLITTNLNDYHRTELEAVMYSYLGVRSKKRKTDPYSTVFFIKIPALEERNLAKFNTVVEEIRKLPLSFSAEQENLTQP